MYLFLGIVGELATIVGSAVVVFNGIGNSLLEISKHGYKIDKNVLDGYQNGCEEKNIEKTSGFKKALDRVVLFIPGVNLLTFGIATVKIKKSVMNNDQRIKKVLVPMTDIEKEQYAKIKGKIQKLEFIKFTITKENEEDQNENFAVYPFTTYDEKEEKKVIEEIKQSYIEEEKKANLELLQAQSIFEQVYVPSKTEETKVEEQQWPVLKKTLYLKRK